MIELINNQYQKPWIKRTRYPIPETVDDDGWVAGRSKLVLLVYLFTSCYNVARFVRSTLQSTTVPGSILMRGGSKTQQLNWHSAHSAVSQQTC